MSSSPIQPGKGRDVGSLALGVLGKQRLGDRVHRLGRMSPNGRVEWSDSVHII
jgi:hypothetical protein